MVGAVTTEVVNESDGEIVLKRGNAGIFMILSELTGRGDRFTIKTDPNATYTEYKLVGTSSSGGSFVISSDDCLENERLVIKKDRAERKLRLDRIKRGMSVTEVINDMKYDFLVIENEKKVGVLKAGGEYLIQRDPKGNSEPQQYSLVGGENPLSPLTIFISSDDLVKNQRLTISEVDSLAVTSMVPRGIYLTEVFNQTKTGLKVMRREASEGSDASEMVTLQGDESQNFTIEYDPRTKTEYLIQTMAVPPKDIPIPPEYFLKGKRIDIKVDPAGIRLESAVPRPVPTPTPKPSLLSRIAEGFGLQLGV